LNISFVKSSFLVQLFVVSTSSVQFLSAFSWISQFCSNFCRLSSQLDHSTCNSRRSFRWGYPAFVFRQPVPTLPNKPFLTKSSLITWPPWGRSIYGSEGLSTLVPPWSIHLERGKERRNGISEPQRSRSLDSQTRISIPEYLLYRGGTHYHPPKTTHIYFLKTCSSILASGEDVSAKSMW
jgi:hypothetical protein